MGKVYDIKWNNDLKMYINTFNSFIFEGNVNDLQPVKNQSSYSYLSLQNTIAEMYSDKYCVVFYDHTKQSGRVIEEAEKDPDEIADGNNENENFDSSWFNSFMFHSETSFDNTGACVSSPNIELFKEYYTKEYMDKLSTSKKEIQSGNTIDIRRILDVMNDFDEKVKDPKYSGAKPFMFILPNVSRYMTTPGRPNGNENAILMLLFNATQLIDSNCKLMLFVDKINDFPTWFESENNNSAIKKIFIPTPNSNMRETFFDLEMRNFMDPISEDELGDKLKKFSAFTENYSLRRLQQLSNFIKTESASNEDAEGFKNVDNIDKTVLNFEFGENKNPWKDKELKKRISEMGSNIRKEIKGQDSAIARVSLSLKTAITGVNSSKKNDRRPRAIFFLAGPTGTGKTELVKQLAENIFKKQESIIRFDMSEFREEHTDSRLFGAPPGYVGYEAGGELTQAIKQNPFSIVLFDEIEKAAPKIWDKFLQILGDGRLTDGKGETVLFTQSVIIFTSNLGIAPDQTGRDANERLARITSAIKQLETKIGSCISSDEKKPLVEELIKLYDERVCLEGFNTDMRYDFIFDKCYEELGATSSSDAFNGYVSECVKKRINNYFNSIGRPEVLGRIGDENIIVYNFISPKIAIEIATSSLNKFVKFLKNDHESQLDLEISEEARNYVINEVQKPDVLKFGGRGIVGCVEKLISTPVSDFIFDNDGTKLTAVMEVKYNSLVVNKR